MENLIQIGPRIDHGVYQKLKEFAAKRRVSVSLAVELAIIDYLRSFDIDVKDPYQ